MELLCVLDTFSVAVWHERNVHKFCSRRPLFIGTQWIVYELLLVIDILKRFETFKLCDEPNNQ